MIYFFICCLFSFGFWHQNPKGIQKSMSDHLRLIVLASRIYEPSRDNIHKRVWSMRVCGGQTHLTLIFNGASS